MMRAGVDVGGTFTDIVLEQCGHSGESRVWVTKVSSTPNDQSEAIVQGLLKVSEMAGVKPAAINVVFHGTTVATNMAIERAGAEVGMITTRGYPSHGAAKRKLLSARQGDIRAGQHLQSDLAGRRRDKKIPGIW